MYLSKSGDIAGFQFSKAKLNTKNWNSTDHDKNIVPSKVKDIQDIPIPTTSFPDLDFLSLTIPFLCLFLVSMTILLLKTYMLSSTRTEQTQKKFQQVCSTNINTIAPSSFVPIHDDDAHGVIDSGFIYLTPL